MPQLVEILRLIPDHRGRSGRMYKYDSMIMLVLLGFMCGCNSLNSVFRFGRSLGRSEREQLGFLWWQMPSQPSLSVFFRDLDIDVLEQTLRRFVPKGLTMSLDGKRLRGSISGEHPRGVHLLACFAESFGVTAQQKQTKGNEVTAALELLKSMELQDVIITGDAMFADRSICEIICNKGGNYAFTLKDNNKSLKKAAEDAFSL